MKRIYLFFIPLILLVFSCRKKEYPPELITDSQVVFYSNFKANGLPVSLEAGRNGYYMYASFKRDSNGVYNFLGEFKKANSGANSPNSLKIQINDHKYSTVNALPIMDSALQLGLYSYLDDSFRNGYVSSFYSSYNGIASSYSWDFGDGSSSNVANPYHVFAKAGKYKVSLTIEGTNGCVSSVQNVVNVGPNNLLNAYVSNTNATGNAVSLSSMVLGGKAPYAFAWDLGDGARDQSASLVHNYTVSGGYQVKLRVIDANSDTAFVNYNAVTNSDLSSCAANFYFTSIYPYPLNPGLSNILISYTDAAGITYSSANGPQQNSSSFQITSVEEYDVNENNEPIKKLKVKFNCKVYNGAQFIQLDNAEMVMGVSYKK